MIIKHSFYYLFVIQYYCSQWVHLLFTYFIHPLQGPDLSAQTKYISPSTLMYLEAPSISIMDEKQENVVPLYRIFIGYWTNTVFWDRVLWSEFDHRACEVINPTKERVIYLYRIIIYLYKIINIIKYHHIYVGLLIIIKCFEHQFIPKHRIRIDIAFICMLA